MVIIIQPLGLTLLLGEWIDLRNGRVTLSLLLTVFVKYTEFNSITPLLQHTTGGVRGMLELTIRIFLISSSLKCCRVFPCNMHEACCN